MAYLIDTDIIIYSLNGDPAVRDHFQARRSVPKHISVITYGELKFGALKSSRREQNLARVSRVADLFKIVPVSRPVIDIFADIKAGLTKKGTSISDLDLLIAATALSLDLVLVTNNTGHFERVPGLTVENWKK
jgi:tRNA(fMet)-specific endonuclease VapC